MLEGSEVRTIRDMKEWIRGSAWVGLVGSARVRVGERRKHGMNESADVRDSMSIGAQPKRDSTYWQSEKYEDLVTARTLSQTLQDCKCVVEVLAVYGYAKQ